jgi:hypothetical protein
MKRMVACAFLAGLLLCTGCFLTAPPQQVVEPEPAPLVERKGPPPVTPDEVNVSNRRQKAQELADEIERARKELALKTPY